MSDDPQPSYVELTPNAPDVGRVGYKDPSPAPPLKVLFCDHPRRPLAKIRYCSYYGEMFYAQVYYSRHKHTTVPHLK